MPCVAIRTLLNVKSSPMMPRQPEVPNLIMRTEDTSTIFRLPLWLVFRNDFSHMTDRPVVLIADDNDDVVMLLKSYLRPLDCDFITARDGEEALAVAQTRLPELVLLDVMMPKRS